MFPAHQPAVLAHEKCLVCGLLKGMELSRRRLAPSGTQGSLANVLSVIVVGCLIHQTVKLPPACGSTLRRGRAAVIRPTTVAPTCSGDHSPWYLAHQKRTSSKNTAQVIIGLIVFALVFAALAATHGHQSLRVANKDRPGLSVCPLWRVQASRVYNMPGLHRDPGILWNASPYTHFTREVPHENRINPDAFPPRRTGMLQPRGRSAGPLS